MPRDNRILIAIGAGVAVLAAVVIALIFSGGRDPNPEPPPAAQGGLTVDVADAPELSTTRELRCYVETSDRAETERLLSSVMATMARRFQRQGVSLQ